MERADVCYCSVTSVAVVDFLSLEVALNETEVVSGYLAQIKQPAEFSFLCQSP